MMTAGNYLIEGAAGQLEVAVSVPATAAQGYAIICHPHPLFGGTMTNKVVTTLAQVCTDLGRVAIRFNFRGVGKSAGHHDDGRGELADLLAVHAWAQAEMGEPTCWLAGFSFGGWIAVKGTLALGDSITQLVTVAPQVTRLRDEDVSTLTSPWILVQGEQDEIVAADEVFAWAASLAQPPQVIRVAETGHFFHSKLKVLRDVLLAALVSG